METGTGTDPAVDDAGVDDETLAGDAERRPAEEAKALEVRLERLTAERDAIRARLIEAEQQLAELPGLRVARQELEGLRRSPSWRITAPLRGLSHWVRRELAPGARGAVKRALLGLAARAKG